MDETWAVDIWCNLYTPDACRRVYVETKEMANLTKWWGIEEEAKGFTTDAFLERLDHDHIEKILIPSTKMWSHKYHEICYYISVDEVVAVTREAPGRIYGLVGADPFARMDGVREVEHAIKDLGFVGMHVHPYGYALPVNAPDWFPFYAKCAELGVPVVVQVGHSAEAMPSAVARPILMDDVALYFPELTIVLSHMGWPWVEETIALAWKHPNVYIGTTAHAPKYWDKSFVHFANSRGRNKVLFGTDWPVVGHGRARKEIDDLNFRDEVKPLLLRENALKVFRLDDPGQSTLLGEAGRETPVIAR